MGRTGEWVQTGSRIEIRNVEKKPFGEYEAKYKMQIGKYQIGVVQIWEQRLD